MDLDIPPLDAVAMEKARQRQESLTKPPGSLGRLESFSVDIAGMTADPLPDLSEAVVITMAGDHGIVEEDVSAFPQSVTAAMVSNFAGGGAAVNALASTIGVRNLIVDIGVATEIDDSIDGIVRERVGNGTANFAKERAMSRSTARHAVETGQRILAEHAPDADIVALGDMGIGNTSASAAVTAAITGVDPATVTDRGSGIDDDALEHKIDVVRDALELHDPDSSDGIDVLSAVGGFELAGLAGVALEAASRRIPVVVDGFITGAAALAAMTIDERVESYLLPSHQSVEAGHPVQHDALGIDPLFDLEMRLGEGTGGVLAIGIYRAACTALREMATFEEAGIPTG